MAHTNFSLRNTKSATATVFYRVQMREPSLNIRLCTGIKVDVSTWNSSRKWDRFAATEEGRKIEKKISLIKQEIDRLINEEKAIRSNADKPVLEEAINKIVNDDAIKLDQERKEIAKKKELEQKKNIIAFYNSFIEGIESGVVKHGDAESYRATTIANWKSFGIHLNRYCKKKKDKTFDDIDKRFADGFCADMEKQGVMPSTINKYIICFRKLCNKSYDDGVHDNARCCDVWKERKVDNNTKRAEIYLTDEEINAIYNYPFEGIDAEARDLFMLGCLSCQRYSDYGTLTRANFGKNINGTPVIMVKQTKTGNYVEIPILDDRIFEICDKYDYQFPRINARRINDYLQVCMRKVADVCPSLNDVYTTILTQQERHKEETYAKLKQKVADGIKLTKEEARTYRNMEAYATEHDGQPLYARNPEGDAVKYKWELITTHTARRSGVTNLYKSGILDTREMMAISGHQTEKVFEEYIKMGKSEMADRIAAKVKAAKLNMKGGYHA